MEATPEYKFGEKVLPNRNSPADSVEVAVELADDLLDASSAQRTQALNSWAAGQQPAETSAVAGRYLNRHRWLRVGNSWVDDYDVADLERRAEFIGKPAVAQLQRQIVLTNLELQHVAMARAQQEPAGDADAKLAELEAGLQQRLLLLAAQFEAAAGELRQRAEEWDSRPRPPPAPSASASPPGVPDGMSASGQPAARHGGRLADSGIAAAAAGLLCGVGFTHFVPRLFRRDKSFARSLLGFGVVTLASALALLSPAQAKVGRRRQDGVGLVPSSGAGHVNVLVAGSSEEES